MKNLQGMSVLITGGGSGIGAGTARHMVRGGARVTICGRREDKIKAVAEQLGENCLAVQADIAEAADRERLVAAAVEHGGGLGALVNNAGNMYRVPVIELDEQKLKDIFQVNVIAGMMLAGLCVPHLEKTEGAIVFIGSTHTRRAFPPSSPYAATKAAVEGLTRSLAAELGAKKIRVGCVCPGAVHTEINVRAGLMTEQEATARYEAFAGLHALGRIGTDEEIAEAIDYLIRAEWTTGAIIDVDGGIALGLTTA